MTLKHFFFLFITLNMLCTLQGSVPANFDSMLRGYCFAGNKTRDTNALGGYGGSGNLPIQLTGSQKNGEGLTLEIIEDENAVFTEAYEGIIVRLVNYGDQQESIQASDSRIGIIQEALDKDGQWKAIEYLPSSWCGNSRHNVYLDAAHYWNFKAPKYSGEYETKLRFALVLKNGITLHSRTYNGSINKMQFLEKQGHQRISIMDPYNE